MEKFNKDVYEKTIKQNYEKVVPLAIKRAEGKLRYAYEEGLPIKACIFKGIDYYDESQAKQIIEYFENLDFKIHKGSEVYCITPNFCDEEPINVDEEMPTPQPPYVYETRGARDVNKFSVFNLEITLLLVILISFAIYYLSTK